MANRVMQQIAKLFRVRYSLKTLFVLFTVACLWLGQRIQYARNQEHAVRAIEAAGGRIWYGYQSDGRGKAFSKSQLPGPDWLRRWVGRHFFTSVVVVEFHDVSFEDADLQRLAPYLKRLVKLRSLALSGTSVTDEGLPCLAGLKSLESLFLDSLVQGDGLEFLADLPRLNSVSVLNGQFSDVGMKHISRVSGLKILSVVNVQITDEGLAHLRPLQKLERLDIFSRHLTDAGLRHLRHLGSLKSLNLFACEQLSDAGLRHLRHIRRLEVLKLKATALSDEGLMRHWNPLGSFIPPEVTLTRSQLTAAGLEYLEPLPHLQRIVVYDYQMDANGRFDRRMRLRAPAGGH